MKTQKISRKNLAIIYKSVCDGWQKKIAKLLVEQQTSNDIEVSRELLQEAYNAADETQKKMMEEHFKIGTPKSIGSLYKTWEAVVKKLGKANCVLPYPKPKDAQERSLNAQYKLFKIIPLYNNGYVFDWKNINQHKWMIYKYLSDGSLVADAYWLSDCACPADLAIKDKETVLEIIANFPDVVDDYLMI